MAIFGSPPHRPWWSPGGPGPCAWLAIELGPPAHIRRRREHVHPCQRGGPTGRTEEEAGLVVVVL
eukprot:8513090-Pyramimonas_sp.AAC.1